MTEPHPIEAIRATLRQLDAVLADVDAVDYTAEPTTIARGTIGGHMRHCLDHLRAALGGSASGVIDYDTRVRGTDEERNPVTARQNIAALDQELSRFAAPLNQPVTVTCMMTADGAPVDTPSSVGRELAFVLSHTIHHAAMIAGLVEWRGGSVPERFGYAPSTVAALDAASCAR